MTDPRAWFEFLKQHSDELRQLGVLSIQVAECGATLAPYSPPPSGADVKTDVAPEPRNVWDDPASYPNGEVPGFRIEKFDVED